MHAASYTIKERLLARLQFLLDKRDFFMEGAIALEALSETTNGDAYSVAMNPACQLLKFFQAQSSADSADEKSGLACTGAASR
jgi:hypothetical protein